METINRIKQQLEIVNKLLANRQKDGMQPVEQLILE